MDSTSIEAAAKEAKRKMTILEEASKIVYGDPANNLMIIARLWDSYLGRPYGTMTASDVCNLMVLFKVARLQNDPTHRDSLVDICGYTALNKRVQDEARLNDDRAKDNPSKAKSLELRDSQYLREEVPARSSLTRHPTE